MKQPDSADYTLGVIGAGAMGQGIAQLAIQAGIGTLLLDARDGAATAAKNAILGRLNRLAEKGRLGQSQVDAAMARLEAAAALSALAPCDAVIEAVTEDLELKRGLFRQIEAVVSRECLIASNTSSLPIAAIAAACERRGRVAGMHFFNPAPVMRLVEVIRAAETSRETVEALAALAERMTRTPVTVKDSPGFLVNAGGRAYTTEALRMAHEGVATPAQIDAILRDCRGFRMGPFELMDLTGIDVNFPVSAGIYEAYFHDPRLKTAPNHRALLDAGRLGRKTRIGWYAYGEDGSMVDAPSPDYESVGPLADAVALAEPDAALAAFCAEIGLAIASDDGERPILAAPIGDDATHMAVAARVDHRRLVCVDLSGDVSRRVTLMTAPGAEPAALDAVAAAVKLSGRAPTAIKDSPGFVAQRMTAMVANLGCYLAEIGLAEPQDIDTAMKLGLNYPLGPLELAEDLGRSTCLRVLTRLQEITGEDRYRPTLWLKRRAALGLSIYTPP